MLGECQNLKLYFKRFILTDTIKITKRIHLPNGNAKLFFKFISSNNKFKNLKVLASILEGLPNSRNINQRRVALARTFTNNAKKRWKGGNKNSPRARVRQSYDN